MTLLSSLQKWLQPCRWRLPARRNAQTPISPLSMDDEEVFIAELHRLGLHHLRRGRPIQHRALAPEQLLVGLARSAEARVRGTIVPLLLMRPSYGSFVSQAESLLMTRSYAGSRYEAPTQWVPGLYGQAAAYLQVQEAPKLRAYAGVNRHWAELPDFLSTRLDVPNVQQVRSGQISVQDALQQLERIHIELAHLQAYAARLGYEQFLVHLYHALEHPE